MSLDAALRRYRLVLFGGMVASAAYLQASGVSQLVAGHLVPDQAAPATKTSKAKSATLPTKSGAAVLSRNPFDSITGPLDGKPLPTPKDGEEPVKPPSGDPYQDTPCSGVRASLVTATEDPAWSFASLSSSDGEKLYRIGSKVGSFTVQHIGYYDSPEHDVFPRVWLAGGSTRCLVDMGAAEPTSAKTPTAPTSPSAKNSKKAQIEAQVKSKIKKVGENQYEVDRSGVELIIKNYAKLAGSLRGKPTKEGMRIGGIKPNDILSELGLKTGDMLQSINGFDMSDPDKAVDAYAKLRKAGQLDIQFSRDGAPQTVGVKITK